MTALRRAIDEAADKLSAAGIDTARVDAEYLAAHTAGVDRGRLAWHEPDETFFDRYRELVTARARRMTQLCTSMMQSEPDRHADMAAGEPEPLVKPLRIHAGMMREQFDQLATLGARFRNSPFHHLLADATAAAMTGDANILDQAARGAQ